MKMNQRMIASLLGLILTATGPGCSSTKAVETSDSDAVAEEA